ncbi:MAG: hypothetical protein IT371_31545 [Deltaproteobacteria bacterium]|nr:hypothetical protein [Deltaproteobacteria bacterium]
MPGASPTSFEERLLGFDVRVPSTEWSPERRSAYLLRDVSQPYSVDPVVWPSLFDGIPGSRPSWVGPFQDLWEDLAVLRASLSELAGSSSAELVAATVHARRSLGLGDFLEAHRGYDPRTAERVPLPLTSPAVRDERWPLLGYDVGDTWGLSGLTNCAYDARDPEDLRSAWAARLNDRHLFASAADAEAYSAVTNSRVPEHAPFYVFGLWSVRVR